jgi:hypothetical protein
MLLQKFRELGLSHAEMGGLERLPDFFAVSVSSGMVDRRS